MNFQNLNISTLLMEGQSTGKDRLAAWFVSIAALLAFLLAFIATPGGISSKLDLSGDSLIDYFALALQVLGGIVLISAFQGLLFPKKKDLSTKVRSFTPIGYIENKDNLVINRAYNEVIDFSLKTDFRKAIELGQYEPSILTFGNMRVIAAQKQGNLANWINTKERLSTVCNFLYLCHRAEQKKEQYLEHGQTDIF